MSFHLLASAARHLLALILGAWLCASAAAAGEAAGPAPTIPAEKDPNRHAEFLTIAKAGGVDLLFLGDSITDGWRAGGKTVWDKYFAPLKAANFGIGGDRTEHVIWRLRHGELEGIQPKLVVLMIGTNNGDPAADVAAGIKTIIDDIHERSPRSKILLLGIFPRGEHPGDRVKNTEVNTLIAKFATASPVGRVVYLDIGQKFLTPDGTLTKDIMPDLLHPNEKGYQIWADAIIDPVKQLLQADPNSLAPAFLPPSTVAKVAKVEAEISSGKVGSGAKSLEKLTEDKDAKTAEAAKASLAQVTSWKTEVDAEIAKRKEDGDLYAAAELAEGMARAYSGGGDAGKGYKTQAQEWKKDTAYAAGKEFEKLAAIPSEERKDARFAKLVEAFAKKYPGGYYSLKAQALVPAK